MARKSGLEDVAAVAGVAIATVDRVLNERGGVRPETARRVLAAARHLGLRRMLPSSHRRTLRIGVFLNRPELPLIGRMNQAFLRLAATLDRSVVVQRTMLADDEPERLAGQLRAAKCDAAIVYALEHATVTDAIAALSQAGVAIVTLTSDLPATSRMFYVGIDHFAAGQTAGYFMAGMARRPGPVLVLCHRLGFHSHAERIRGLTQALAAHGDGLAVADILEGGDELPRSEQVMRAALSRHPDVAGIYNVGAANGAVGSALREAPPARPPLFVGHELTDDTRRLLQDGTMTLTIDQNPERQARHAIDLLLSHFGYAVAGTDGMERVPFTLHGRYNIGA